MYTQYGGWVCSMSRCTLCRFIYFNHDIFQTEEYSSHSEFNGSKGKVKAVPLQAWIGPEGSRNFRFPDFMTTAQDGGKVVSLTQRPPLSPGNTPGTHFCQRLSRPQGHIATGRIMSLKNSNDTIGNRTRDLPVCSAVS